MAARSHCVVVFRQVYLYWTFIYRFNKSDASKATLIVNFDLDILKCFPLSKQCNFYTFYLPRTYFVISLLKKTIVLPFPSADIQTGH